MFRVAEESRAVEYGAIYCRSLEAWEPLKRLMKNLTALFYKNARAHEQRNYEVFNIK